MKENEIRPKEIFETYLKLSNEDAKNFTFSSFESIPCPACSSVKIKTQLEKNKFIYSICEDCGSLFCNPRPSFDQLNHFYKNSKSAEYWSKVFSPAVAEVRREKLFKKKAILIKSLLDSVGFMPTNVCDVGSGYGVFLEELGKLFTNAKLYGIEPSLDLANVSRGKGIETLQENAEDASDWHSKFQLVISSEVIEHVFSPRHFIESLYNLVLPGGYVLITGLGYEGFDILSLQADSKSISPPHHLNFLSIKGFETIFKSIGFQDIKIITPGELDVDIVVNSGQMNEFVRVLSNRGPETLNDFQEFLRKHKLSSHIWVIGRK